VANLVQLRRAHRRPCARQQQGAVTKGALVCKHRLVCTCVRIYVSIYMCVCVHVYVCVCVCVCIYVCIYINIYICTYIFIYIYIYIFVYIYTYIYIYMLAHIQSTLAHIQYTYICVYMYVYTYIHIYTYIHRHRHIYVHIHIHMQKHACIYSIHKCLPHTHTPHTYIERGVTNDERPFSANTACRCTQVVASFAIGIYLQHTATEGCSGETCRRVE